MEKSSHSNGTTESPISDEDATHVLLSQKPDGSRNTYEELKKEMLELIPLVGSGDDPVVKASERVLTRLREIDAAAAISMYKKYYEDQAKRYELMAKMMDECKSRGECLCG